MGDGEGWGRRGVMGWGGRIGEIGSLGGGGLNESRKGWICLAAKTFLRSTNPPPRQKQKSTKRTIQQLTSQPPPYHPHHHHHGQSPSPQARASRCTPQQSAPNTSEPPEPKPSDLPHECNPPAVFARKSPPAPVHPAPMLARAKRAGTDAVDGTHHAPSLAPPGTDALAATVALAARSAHVGRRGHETQSGALQGRDPASGSQDRNQWRRALVLDLGGGGTVAATAAMWLVRRD